MWLDRRLGGGKKESRKVMIGYDLREDYVQISYGISKDSEIQTLTVADGTERYNIPLVLWKKKGVNQWLFGTEALQIGEDAAGFRIERLMDLVRRGRTVRLDGESFDPVTLLTLFVKMSLSLLEEVFPQKQWGGIMFTLDELDTRMREVMKLLCADLPLVPERIFFQSHVESFYYYMSCQPEELWNTQVLLCDYDNHRLKVYELSCNGRSVPKVVFIDEAEYKELDRRGGKREELDQCFLDIVTKRCSNKVISSVYLVGDGYRDGWMDQSRRFLCRGRRVFQGNNLYSLGACQGIREKLLLERQEPNWYFLDQDKLRTQISMQVLHHREEVVFPILEAGKNWFEAMQEFEFLLEQGNTLTLRLTSLDGNNFREVSLRLDDLEERPDWMTRLRMQVRMQGSEQLVCRVWDLGFGELYPASGKEWTEVFDIG
ncbi:MAG: hypothetical protein IKM28_00090 [Lachnospiraceae bacterium]|nr:hypothetical protein [Lachnospiraceae bacterium]